jgi:DNA-directed RNA polymerase subunit M/transcription elongation factor TFIIS
MKDKKSNINIEIQNEPSNSSNNQNVKNKKFSINIDVQNEVSPFHNSNYEFITANSVDIKESYIRYAEKTLDRAKNQLEINKQIEDIDLALKIELSIFEYSLVYCLNNNYDPKFLEPVYKDKLDNIIMNLNPKTHIKNKTFKENIINGKINPNDVAFMAPAQVHPEKWQYIINKKNYKEWRENNIAYSTAYKCRKCGESKSKVTQAQTRSADEPMSTFISCMVCHNTYKFG